MNLASALPSTDALVTGITHNSTWVTPGAIFAAIIGSRSDAHQFIPQAIAAGAVAVMGEHPPEQHVDLPIPYIQVSDTRRALAFVAAELNDHPSRELITVGITGTDGKTTTSWLTRHLVRHQGIATGMLSTAGYELPDGNLRHFPAHFTTPESPQVQQLLAQMHNADAEAAVIEASSHALTLQRLHMVDWDVTAWTNLTREHLDFHGSLDAYFEAKASLIAGSPHAVLNADDPWIQQLLGRAGSDALYSASGFRDAQWRALDIETTGAGIAFTADTPVGQERIALPMIGEFNVANALAALAITHRVLRLRGAPMDLADLRAGLESFPGVPGRMQLVPTTPSDPRVVVDFAHAPPALEQALTNLRRSTQGRLWVVVGSAGGLRDHAKHAELGRVAAALADQVVFTEDDPHESDLNDILAQMRLGAGESGDHTTIPDRVEAINWAVSQAQPGDTVLLAGKGHESTLARTSGDIPWDELAVAAEAIRGRLQS